MAKPLAHLGLVAGALSCASLAAAQHQGIYTYPDLHGDTIVFVCEEDLFSVPATGGVATRLTTGPAREYYPRISPDGKTIAYSSNHDRNLDVYTIPIEGGQPTRLTWHPGSDFVAEWSPDGKFIYYYTSWEHPFGLPTLKRVAADGGAPEVVNVGVAGPLGIAPDGDLIAFNRLTSFSRAWKRYLGGTQDDIWVGRVSTGQFEKMTTFPGHDSEPFFVDGRIYFTSERDGRMNLWSLTPEGRDLRQHTAHKDFDVRSAASGDGSRLVYQHGGDLRVLDTATGEDTRVEVEIVSAREQLQPRYIASLPAMESFDLSPDGKRLVATIRGDVHNIPVDKGLVRPVAATPASREREARFAGKDGELVLYWSDKSGEEQLYKASALDGSGEECLTCEHTPQPAWRFPVSVAPSGTRVAWADEQGRLYWADLEGFEPKLVDDSDKWEVTEYSWSPDSRYLAYSLLHNTWMPRIYIYDTQEHSTRPVTDAMYGSSSPAWDPEGKFLYYLSSRTFDPLMGEYDWNAVLLPMAKVYSVALAADTEDPYWPKDYYEEKAKEEAKKKKEEAEKKAEEEKAKADDEAKKATGGDEAKPGAAPAADATQAQAKEGEEAKPQDSAAASDPEKQAEATGATDADEAKDGEQSADDEEEEGKKVEVKIDWDGIGQRQIELPNQSPMSLAGLSAVKGRLYYTATNLAGQAGVWGEDLRGADPVLMTYELGDEEAEPAPFATNVTAYSISRDGTRIALRTFAGFQVGDTGASFSAEAADTPPMFEVRPSIDPALEWAQIYDELYRLYRDFFYTPDMAGTDWKAEHAKYRALLPRVSTRFELFNLMREAVGELGTGHTYVGFPTEMPNPETIDTAVLGADLELDAEAGAFRFKKILRGDRWNPEEVGPLAAAHVDVKEGEYLLAIDGKQLSPGEDPYRHLHNKAGMNILLTVNDKPVMEGARELRVIPGTSDGLLRYRDWVDRNRAYVAEKSGGEMIYIHIPDMGTNGLIEFFRQWYPQLDQKAKGLVVDVRFNGGGNVSPIVIERLRRVLYAMGNSRHFGDTTYPWNVFHGHMVCLVNESAGSDGDIVTESFRILGLGPIIGTRSWGGTVGIRGGKPHVDGSVTMIPEFGFWDEKRGYDMENSGVTPDHEIDNTPMDDIAGRDAQLDKAIEVLAGRIKSDPMPYPQEPAPKGNSLERFRERAKQWMTKP